MDQGITIFHKNENLQPSQPAPSKPKRGPLSVHDQLILIELCRQRAHYKAITHYTTNFWIGIETELQSRIGRRYSHYSCRRRINEYIAQRTLWREAVLTGHSIPFQDIPIEVCREVDGWMIDNDEMDLEREITHLNALSKMVESDHEVSQMKKLQRVADWVKSIPAPGEYTRSSFESLHQSQTLSSSSLSRSKIATRFSWSVNRISRLQTPVLQAGRTLQMQNVTAQTAAVTTCEPVKQEPQSPARLKQGAAPQSPVQTGYPSRPGSPSLPPALLLARRAPATSQSLLHAAYPAPPTPLSPHAGQKRAREDDGADSSRAAPRPRLSIPQTQDESCAIELSGGGSLPPQNLPVFQNAIEGAFGKFWANVLPKFSETDASSLAKFESILHNLFEDVGTSLVKAMVQLDEVRRANRHS